MCGCAVCFLMICFFQRVAKIVVLHLARQADRLLVLVHWYCHPPPRAANEVVHQRNYGMVRTSVGNGFQ